jgi:hypothetical protein
LGTMAEWVLFICPYKAECSISQRGGKLGTNSDPWKFPILYNLQICISWTAHNEMHNQGFHIESNKDHVIGVIYRVKFDVTK